MVDVKTKPQFCNRERLPSCLINGNSNTFNLGDLIKLKRLSVLVIGCAVAVSISVGLDQDILGIEFTIFAFL